MSPGREGRFRNAASGGRPQTPSPALHGGPASPHSGPDHRAPGTGDAAGASLPPRPPARRGPNVPVPEPGRGRESRAPAALPTLVPGGGAGGNWSPTGPPHANRREEHASCPGHPARPAARRRPGGPAARCASPSAADAPSGPANPSPARSTAPAAAPGSPCGLALVLGLAGVAAAAVLGHRAAGRAAEAERGRLHRTQALVLDRLRAEETGASRWSGGYEKRVDTSVSWTSPDGLARTGTVEAPRSAATGSTVTLWVDDDGRPAAPPATAVGLVVGMVCTGLAGTATLTALIGGVLTLRLRALDRRAARDWERCWAHWEPRWSGRASQPQDD